MMKRNLTLIEQKNHWISFSNNIQKNEARKVRKAKNDVIQNVVYAMDVGMYKYFIE